MARVAATLLVGALLFVVLVFIVRVADALKVHSNTLRNIVILIVIAAVAFWYFGNGMVYEYFNK